MKAASKAYNQTEYFLSKYLVKFKILSALLFAASLANAGAGAGNNWWQRSGGQRKVIRGLRSGDPGARKTSPTTRSWELLSLQSIQCTSCQKLSKVVKSCQKLSKIVKGCQKL